MSDLFFLYIFFLNFLDHNVTVENIRQFVRRHSNLKIVVDDCLEQFDKLALKFMETLHRSSSQSNEVKLVVNETQLEAEKLQNEKVSNFFSAVCLFVLSALRRSLLYKSRFLK